MAETSKVGVVRKAIDVAGIVQGVGFRPFVYRLAHECQLSGFIVNTPGGVTIEVQGDAEVIDRFLERLPAEIPPLAKITAFVPRDAEPQSDSAFRIVSSRRDAPPRALISPDVAVCGDCLREMMSPRDRRFRYPFINCTNCGPRFTIIRDIPYDRAGTSMASFRMCAACQAEYNDPSNRRFHAQPNACWDCGPQLQLWSADGSHINTAEPIREAAHFLEHNSIVAVKGLGGFHLACNARSEAAVRLLRERKRRVEKPFAGGWKISSASALSTKAPGNFCSRSHGPSFFSRARQKPVSQAVSPRAIAFLASFYRTPRFIIFFFPVESSMRW
jgi:hydrogenase maturation protein HypF